MFITRVDISNMQIRQTCSVTCNVFVCMCALCTWFLSLVKLLLTKMLLRVSTEQTLLHLHVSCVILIIDK